MSTIESDDYKRGWYDGYKAAKYPYPQHPITPTPTGQVQLACSKCGMLLNGVMGFVCPNQDCPVQPKITSSLSNQETL